MAAARPAIGDPTPLGHRRTFELVDKWESIRLTLGSERQADAQTPVNGYHGPVIGTLIRGGLAGAAATWLMDQVTTGIQQQQSPSDAEREAAARPNGKGSVMNLVDLSAARLGLKLDESSRDMAGQVMHYGLGIGPGALYALLRSRVPGLGMGHGLLFGAILFVANDEYMNTVLGLSGPPDAYPVSSHFRGLIGHLVLGVATDVGVDAMGG